MKKDDSLQTDTTQRLLKIIKERTKICTQYELLQKKMLVKPYVSKRRTVPYKSPLYLIFSDK